MSAQFTDLRFRRLTSKEGLTNEIVYKVIQDYKGFIWIATENGLHRYDGYELENFLPQSSNPNSLSGTIVFDMVEDIHKNLWIATENGLDCFNRKKRNFIHIPLVNNNDTNFATTPRALFVEKNGDLLVGTFGYGLLKVVSGTYIMSKYTQKEPFWSKVSKIFGIKSIIRDRKGNVWLSTQNTGVYFLNDSAKTIDLYKFNKENHFYSYYLSALLEDHNGTIWAATEYGLNRFDFEKKTFQPVLNENSSNGSLPNTSCTNIYKDSNNLLWISLSNGGINALNPDKMVFQSIYRNKFDVNSLNSDVINATYIDKQGILWVSTNRGGVNYCPFYNSYKFKNIVHIPQNTHGLSHPSVGAIFKDKDNNLWVGTDGGGINVFEAKTGKTLHFRHQENNPRSLGSDNILTITQDTKGTIWIGGYKCGLCKYNPQTGDFYVFRHIERNPNSLNHDDVRSILPLSDGTLWIATNGGGIQKFDPVKKKFESPFENNKNFRIGPWCLKIFKDSKENLWFSSYYGLAMIDHISGKVRTFQKSNKDKNTLTSNWVFCITEDFDRKLWVGTEAGLNIFDPETFKINRIENADDLPSNIINGLLTDTKGNIWISTEMGISKYDMQLKKFLNYDINDGLPGNQYIHGSYFKDNDGTLFFGSTSGLLYFKPEEIAVNNDIPRIYITNILINNKDVPIGGKKAAISQDITEEKKVILRHGQTSITFKYVALNYLSPDKNHYAYMLEGFDKDWNFVDNKRDATYTNLDAGEFTFRVKASNNSNLWNEKGVSIKIIVLPPWWASKWFKILTILLIALSIFSIYFIRTQSLIRQRQKLEHMVHERTLELQEMNTRLEEKQEEIFSQKEELLSQRDNLAALNQKLLEHQQFIEEQNLELESHRNRLEDLVRERTFELEKAMKKAEESDRLKSAFLANMSHEIRTPLNAIVGFTNLIIDPDFSESEKKDFEKIINKNSENLLKLINDILDLSRIEAGEIKVVKTPVNINDLMKSLKIIFTKIIETQNRKNVTLNYTPLEKSINTRTDSQRLNQILSNLIDNAIKYTPEGRIDFGFELIDCDYIQFYVRDTGVGIPKEKIDSIFLRFQKIENDASKLFRGAGLGLAISQQLAQLLGGKIWVESEIEKGSCFFLQIPYETC